MILANCSISSLSLSLSSPSPSSLFYVSSISFDILLWHLSHFMITIENNKVFQSSKNIDFLNCSWHCYDHSFNGLQHKTMVMQDVNICPFHWSHDQIEMKAVTSSQNNRMREGNWCTRGKKQHHSVAADVADTGIQPTTNIINCDKVKVSRR